MINGKIYLNRSREDNYTPATSIWEETYREIFKLESKLDRLMKCTKVQAVLKDAGGNIVLDYSSSSIHDFKVKSRKIFYYKYQQEKDDNFMFFTGIIEFRKSRYYLEREIVNLTPTYKIEQWVRKEKPIK